MDGRWSFRIGLAALAVFAWLALGVASGHAFGFDAAIRNGMHAHAAPALTAVMRFATVQGAPERLSAVALVICLVFALGGRAQTALLFVAAMTGASVLDLALKLAFHRARPEAFFDMPAPRSYSFPSGHALFAACFFSFAAFLAMDALKPGWMRVAVPVAAAGCGLLIGISRIYLGVHYPSDVLGGFAVGLGWVAAVYPLARSAAPRSPTMVVTREHP
jgi:undecaprenyl-diphosphatase